MSETTSMTEQSRAIVQRYNDAVEKGDVDGVLACLSPDVVLHLPPFLPYGGEYQGGANFGPIFEKAMRVLDLGKFQVDYVVADGERVIAICRIPDRATGEDCLLAEQHTLRDGKIVDIRVFYYDAKSMIGAPKL